MVSRGSRRKDYRSRQKGETARRSGKGSEPVERRVSTIRAVTLVFLGALSQAVISPYLTFGLLAPALAVLCIVAATAGLKWSVALPVGFFGGILVDALGSGLFGVGALSGVIASTLASRAGIVGKGTVSPARMAVVVAVSVAAHDSVSVAALGLSGESWPPLIGFLSLGLAPDALLNAGLAYVLGGVLVALVLVKERSWT